VPRLVYVNPANFRQQYVTARSGDPNVPAGYILTSGSDGAQDVALQQYVAGINSLCPDMRLAQNANAIPTAYYIGDQSQDTVATNLKAAGAKNLWINGILGGGTGDK
jgi:hypothetical protein